MKRSEWLIGINEPLSINWLLNDDELRVLYKKVFEHFWIAERLYYDYNNKVDINKQINIDNLETIDTNVISKIITELRWSSGTHMNNGKLIDKLEKLIENFKKKQERLNNEIPSNYNGETFKNNKIDFLKGPFYERLKHMQSEDLPSYVIPIVPSRIDLLQENKKDTSSYKNAEQSINNKISLRKKSYKVRKYIQKHALKMEYTNNFMLDPIVKKAISMFFRNEKFFYTADINYQINNDSANIVIIYSVW